MRTFRTDLRRTLRNSEDLPTLPDILTLVKKVINENRSNADRVAEIIAQDPSMASNILKLANSAYYSRGGKALSSISDAIVRLGMSETEKICTTLSIINSCGNLGGYTDHRQFWLHSITASTMALAVKKACKRDINCSDDQIQLAGLVHDIGVLIMDQYFHETAVEIWKESLRENVPTFINEAKRLGMDHGEIGGYTIRKWNMASPVIDAVTYHHQPTRRDHPHLSCARVIHVADRICSLRNVGGNRSSIEVEGLTDEILEELGLAHDRIPSLIKEAKRELERSDVVLSLSGNI